VVETLKSWLELTIFNNTVRDYTLAVFNLIALVIALMLSKRLLVRHLGKLAARTSNDLDDFMVSLLAQVGPPVFIVTSLYFVTLPLHLEDQVRTVIRYALVIVVTIRAVLILQQVVKYSISKTYRRARPDDAAADTVIKNLTNVVRWAIWALGVVFVLDNLGINISALVAGLGIGGIAVALAAQAVLGDLFSALSIFVDKPFEVGDFIIVDGMMGTVEYVGLKTTRIRSLSGEQLILSNSDLTKSRIKNYKRMETRRIAFKVGVVYQTSLEQTKKIPVLIKNIFQKINGVKLDRVHFESFGDFSLNYEIVYFVLSADYNVYMDKQQEINFAIKEVFEGERIEFAYPTQTVLVQSSAQEKMNV
jgi:small-conductance mechanosensitive channel